MKNIIISFIVLMCISCTEKSTENFHLKGKTRGIENGEVLYLDDVLSRELIDSTLVQDNYFEFTTKLPESPLNVVLRSKDYRIIGFYG